MAGPDAPADRGVKFRIAMWLTIIVLTAGIVALLRVAIPWAWRL